MTFGDPHGEDDARLQALFQRAPLSGIQVQE